MLVASRDDDRVAELGSKGDREHGIGEVLGGRDHSTVIHASKTIERKIKEDPHMQTTIEKLERNLNIRKKL